ncbi:hypothetical protein H5410_031650, partial [Solanum commersonii]
MAMGRCGLGRYDVVKSKKDRAYQMRNHPSVDILRDQCLVEWTREKCLCLCFQALAYALSSIRKDEITESNGIKGEGYLFRSLFGREATYVRFFAMAVRTVVARCCPTLRDLSLSNVSFVGDEGLSEIAHKCHLLEKPDFFQCPTISD